MPKKDKPTYEIIALPRLSFFFVLLLRDAEEAQIHI